MGQLQSYLSTLGEPEGDGWALAETLNTGIRSDYRRVLKAYELVDLEDPEEVHSALFQNAAGRLVDLQRACEPVLQGPAMPRFDNAVGALRLSIDQAWKAWRDDFRPHLGRPPIDAGQFERTAVQHLADANEALARAAEARDSYSELERKASQLLTEVGTGELESFYSEQAEKHAATAGVVLRWVAGIIVALAAGGFALLLTIPDTDDFGALAREAGTRLVVLGALSYGLAFTARLYRVNSHLQSIYEQKSKALQTYRLFVRGLEGDEAGPAILSEIVRAVFTTAETGLIDTSGERTVIESASPLLAALASRRS